MSVEASLSRSDLCFLTKSVFRLVPGEMFAGGFFLKGRFEFLEYFRRAFEYGLGNAGQFRYVDAVGLVGTAWHYLVQEHHLVHPSSSVNSW